MKVIDKEDKNTKYENSDFYTRIVPPMSTAEINKNLLSYYNSNLKSANKILKTLKNFNFEDFQNSHDYIDKNINIYIFVEKIDEIYFLFKIYFKLILEFARKNDYQKLSELQNINNQEAVINKNYDDIKVVEEIQTILNISEFAHNYSENLVKVNEIHKKLVFLKTQNLNKSSKNDTQNDQIKRLKGLLLKAKRNNDELQKEIEDLKKLKNENDKLLENIKNNEQKAADLENALKINQDLTNKIESLKISHEESSRALQTSVDYHISEYNFLKEKLDTVEKSLEEHRSNLKNSYNPSEFESSDFLIEKKRLEILIEELNTKSELDSTKINTLTSEYDQIVTERNDLKLTIYNNEKTIEKLKEESLSHACVLKKREDEIIKLKAEIEKLQAEKSIIDKQSTVSLNQSGNFLSFNEMDKYEEKESQKESFLEQILSTSNSESINNKKSPGINKRIMDDLLDAECENNLLVEQIRALREEIRRLDKINTANFKYQLNRKLLIDFMTSDVETKTNLLSSVLEITDPNSEETERIKEFSEMDIFKKENSRVNSLLGYVSKWI